MFGKTSKKLDSRQRRALTVTLVVAFLFGAYFLRDYVTVVALACILAYLFNPIYKWLLAKTNGRKGLSVGLTLLITFLTIAIPTIIVLTITVNQALLIVDSVKKSSEGGNAITDIVKSLILTTNQLIDKVPGDRLHHLSSTQVFDWLSNNTSTFIKSAIIIIRNVAGGLPEFFAKTIIFIYIFMSVLKKQDRIIFYLRKLNPLNDDAATLYLNRMGAMTSAMVKGQFAIAILQGLVDALLLWLVGVDYFIFWFVLLTFLSIIPLGGGIIVIPIGIVLILTGNIWQGVVLIAGHILIVTNIDNVLRPRFVPHSARLDAALTMLGVFAGIAMFGFAGIVIGPVIMILIVTTVQVYVALADNQTSEDLIEQDVKN